VNEDAVELAPPLTREEASNLAKQLAPYIAKELLITPTICGKGKVHKGHRVSLMNTLFNLNSGDVYIEDFVFFGHNVSVLTGTHAADQFDLNRQRAVPPTGRDIRIGRGAWINSGAIIIGPCTIGEDAVIAAGSVVLGDVRPGWFYAGAPARPKKPVHEKYARLLTDEAP